MEAKGKKEWVAIFEGPTGSRIKMVFPNAAKMARTMANQTEEGWKAVKVYERDASIYLDEIKLVEVDDGNWKFEHRPKLG